MKSYELKPCEVELVVRALRYVLEYAETRTAKDDTDLRALIRKLDPQPMQKHAWMVVYGDETRSHLFDWKADAEDWAKHGRESKVVEVIWEE